ncbi:HD domain-containing protein, partial [Streptomyces thermospinosisporus]|uniref:HD domain-containing protein n=1 Tax=Streptomyces thermospinosisporus TaxID=161482 RepID=UPI0031DCA0C9
MATIKVDWAYGLAGELLRTSLPRRWAHTQGVAARAQVLAPLVGGNAHVLEAAAVLHDIGYAPALAHTGFHPLSSVHRENCTSGGLVCTGFG